MKQNKSIRTNENQDDNPNMIHLTIVYDSETGAMTRTLLSFAETYEDQTSEACMVLSRALAAYTEEKLKAQAKLEIDKVIEMNQAPRRRK